MARRRAGIGAIKKHNIVKEKFAAKGSEIADLKLAHITTQLDTFKTSLEEFASKHKSDIKKNAEFRGHFQQMCARIGVDPLASSKGFWAQVLGVGDFYFELGVQIIEICLSARDRNGVPEDSKLFQALQTNLLIQNSLLRQNRISGLMAFEDLRQRILATSGKTRQDVSEDDMARAIKKLRVLGGGFAVIPVGKTRLVQSVPGELNMDHAAVLQRAEGKSHTCVGELVKELKWTELRARSILEHLVKEGMAWVDDQQDQERLYWFPGLFSIGS